jgi:hypothetical protein
MTRRLQRWWLPVLVATSVPLAPGRLIAQQRCDEPHYRWSVKTDTSLAHTQATPATITAILTQWSAPAIGPDDRCAARSERERTVYVVRGWIRRIETAKDDGDWHIELTADPTSSPDSCIVAEIPLPALGSPYRRARTHLTELLRGRRRDKQGDLDAPLEVRIIGAAFYDGQHRRTTRKRDGTDGGHGRCNSSVRALWELHPVYAVLRP